jgi:hypothetical protein
MKTLIVLLGGFFLLSVSVKAQAVNKNQAKIENKKVVLAKKAPLKLQTIQPTSFKTIASKEEEKKATKKTVAIKPKK